VGNVYIELLQISQENTYQTIRIGLVFVKDTTKHSGVFLRFTVPTAVQLQNVNAKFHKVV